MLYGADGDLGNPLADLTADARTAGLGLDAVREYELTGKPHTDPALDLSSSVGGGGHLAIYDEQMNLVHEVPETRASFGQRLRSRLAAAVADAVTEDPHGFTPADVRAAYVEATELLRPADVEEIAASCTRRVVGP